MAFVIIAIRNLVLCLKNANFIHGTKAINSGGALRMDKAKKLEIIKEFGRNEQDTGSPEVQIAL